ncbi:hypothetical protein DRP04_06145 [Archaeoglobales archaeon]|nr:MAG: hypothetical protein DRP04_06145 [Archaeoglobales archaeon]
MGVLEKVRNLAREMNIVEVDGLAVSDDVPVVFPENWNNFVEIVKKLSKYVGFMKIVPPNGEPDAINIYYPEINLVITYEPEAELEGEV